MLASDDPKAKIGEIRQLLAEQEQANANLRARLAEIEEML